MGGEGSPAPDPRTVSLGEREALADNRDRNANRREGLADERDRKADRREALADERQRRLDDRARAVAAGVKELQEQSPALIERSQALLAAGEASLQLHGAEIASAGGHHQPRQAETGTAARSGPNAGAASSGPGTAIQRAIVLRARLSATLGALAATEEEVARVHETLADQRPGNTDHYRQAAAEARSRAAQLRDIERHFHDLNRQARPGTWHRPQTAPGGKLSG